MAREDFKLESELPGPQPVTGPQTGGGAQGLLDVLGAIGSGLGSVGGAIGSGLLQTLQALPEVAAYRQAALGQPEALRMLQEQRQQQQQVQQLQQMATGGEFGEYGGRIQDALKTGGVKAAQKVAAQIPAFKSISDLVKKSNLSSSDREAILSAGLVDPNRALDLYRSLSIIEKQTAKQQAVESAKEQRELRREERQVARVEKRLPGNILASEFEKGALSPTDVPAIIGALQAKGVRIPGTAGEQQIWVRNLLATPALKAYIKTEEKPGIVQSMLDFFKGKQAPAPVVAPAATAPAIPGLTPEQQKRLEELRRKQGR